MNPEEYANLERVEAEHWYYRGKREIVLWWMRATGRVDASARLADCGAGTGAFACEMSRVCRVTAVDDHRESLEILRRRDGIQEVLDGSCTRLPMDDHTFDFVTALDVLEHIEDDAQAFRELLRVTKPGGIILITVPALMSLWSDWDVSLRHFRRYDRPGLKALVSGGSAELLHLNYMNFPAFPAVWLVRKLRRWLPAGPAAGRSEDRIPPRLLNRMLKFLFVRASCQRWIRWPFGVGLLAVLRKLP